MEYDKTTIPVGYDRAREHGPKFLDLWMRTVEAAVRGRTLISSILDLGCGTGRFSGELAEHFGASVIGVDPSERMLEQARAKRRSPEESYEIGTAEAIPIPNASVDLVFISMAYHHFEDPMQAARECRRVLRASGIVFLRAASAEQIQGYPYVPFIPETVPILQETLPTSAQMRAPFEAAGFRMRKRGLVLQQIAATHAEYADKLEAGGDSVLVQLPPDALAAGLARLRAHAAAVDPKPVHENIDYFIFEI